MASRSNDTTLRPSTRAGYGSPGRAILLTVLSHPDLRRSGERAVLWPSAAHTVYLSRRSPELHAPGSVWEGRPLEDPYLSRDPLLLTRDAAGVLISRGQSSTRLEVDGRSVGESVHVPNEAVERGAVLELSGRVALLLHASSTAALQASPAGLPTMIGAGEAWTEVTAAVERVADLHVPVLLRGESGTGKELVARALHDRGGRRDGPFVAVNLGALSTSLAASELFGHVKGAFTGAVGAREGFFSAADGGTLFLDELGEASPEIQAMLLRTLETREIVPVGSHTSTEVDVRVVAATDSDLEARARQGDFKEPLLHRLSAYVIRLPALRDRRDDVGRLVLHFAREVLRELDDEARLEQPILEGEPWMEASLMARLVGFPWPGNVRQLKNVVRQLVIDARDRPLLRPGQGLDGLLADAGSAETGPVEGAPEPSSPLEESSEEASPPPRRPAEVTDPELEAALAENGYEPAAAARRLGISRASLYTLIRRHPTLRTAEDVPEHELRAALAATDGDNAEAARRLRVSARALARRRSRDAR